MAAYLYPAVFHANADGSFTVRFPDLPGCISEGKALEEAFSMAEKALSLYIECALEMQEKLPASSNIKALSINDDEFISYIRAEIRDNRAVRRTVSLPKWMDEQVSSAGISLSRVLQEALKEKFRFG